MSDIDWGNDRLNAYVEPLQVANTEFLKQQPDSSVTTAQTFADTDISPAKVLGDLEQTVAAFYASGELPEYRPRRKSKPLLNCFFEPDCWFPLLSKTFQYDSDCSLKKSKLWPSGRKIKQAKLEMIKTKIDPPPKDALLVLQYLPIIAEGIRTDPRFC